MCLRRRGLGSRVSIAEARKIRNQLLEVQRVAMQWLCDLDHMLDELTPSN